MVASDSGVLLTDGDHIVEFFDDSEHLLGPVSGYLTASVLEGDAVIVLAIPAHCDMFRDALMISGIDVQASEAEGTLLMLDALRMAEEIMTDGCLDAQAFEELVALPVRQAAGDDRPVRVYGELVSVLWEAGDVAAAVELERLWNQLGSQVPFALFCSYPSVIGTGATEAFSAVCGLHSEVRGQVPGTSAAVTKKFDGTPHAVFLARSFTADTLQQWDRHRLVDDVVVVVSELATNAVVHAQSNFTVELSTRNASVRVAVADLNVDPPKLQEPGESFVSGRGLYLVDAIAHRWGHSMVAGGKVVWAEIQPPDVVVERSAVRV